MGAFSKIFASWMVATVSVSAMESRELQAKKSRSMSVMERKADFWAKNRANQKLTKSSRNAPLDCTSGSVTVNGDVYDCSNVDFLSLVGSEEMRIIRPGFPSDAIHELADMWGWLSPSGREINLVCLSTGVRFIDSTDPVNPLNLGFMASNRPESYWCDIKVHKNVAYIVKDRFRSQAVEPTNGIHVFDLLQLEDNDGSAQVEYFPNSIYDKHGSSHNIVMNTETEFLYTVGNSGDSCSGGLHAVDISDPLNPVFAGCGGADAYVHDAQCVVYRGPDANFAGREICFAFDEDTLTVFDVEDKDNMFIISKTAYENNLYTHQGWLISDMSYLILNDELDELDGGLPRTRSRIFDVRDLSAPVLTGFYDHPADSIDHNLYNFGAIHANGWGGSPAMENPPSDQYIYYANYCSGLRITDLTNVKATPPVLNERGFFDVSPDCATHDWYGSWSTYMHPSGVIGISGIEKGFFLVRFRDAFNDPTPVAPPTNAPVTPTNAPTPPPQTPFPTFPPQSSPTAGAPTTTSGSDDNGEGVFGSFDEVVVIAIIGALAAVIGLLTLLIVYRLAFAAPAKAAEPTAAATKKSTIAKKAAPSDMEAKVANPAFSEEN